MIIRLINNTVKLLLISLAFLACNERYDEEKDFEVYFYDYGAIITGYIGSKTNVSIPQKIKKLPVTRIGESAFKEKGIMRVIIPDTVTSIGNDAFTDNELVSVVIPGSVKTIGDRAFAGNKLAAVSISSGTGSIGKWAFAANKLTVIDIPNSVVLMGEGAFRRNRLTRVTISDNIHFIEPGVFQHNQLTSIIIPDNVIYIGGNAFVDNPQFASITIGENVLFLSIGMRFDAIDKNFDLLYTTKGKRAGTYAKIDGRWRFKLTGDSGAGEEFEDDLFEEPEPEPDEHSFEYVFPLIGYYNIKKVSASSALSDAQGHYPAANLVDQSWRSWAEGAKGGGIGESFTLTLSDSYEQVTVKGFAVKNGYGNLDYYGKNNRVKSFKIYIDGQYSETIAVKDSISFEQYALKEPVECETIRFEIDDVYPGTEYDDTCIAEIALLRGMVSDSAFYENILFWLQRPGVESDIQYENNIEGIASISDIDRLLIKDYLPFDSLVEHGYAKKSKIALLESQSLLKLTDNLPRLDGATAMYPLYSSFVRAVYPEIDLVKDTGDNGSYISSWSLFNWPYYPDWPDYLEEEDVEKFKSIVRCNKTSEAYRRLIDGETDIIFCYEPSQADRNAVAEKGKSFKLTPIAKDAFVFIVNEKNIINNVTQQQVRDIYSGRVTNWKVINGVDEPVIAYQRRENSGSQTILQSIMRGEKLMRPLLDGEYVSYGMGSSIRKITSDFYNYNSAIGYTFLFYLTQMAGSAGVKTLSVDGVAPTRQNIQNNNYPFVQTVYAVTTGNESENTKKFIEWILSSQGQELVAKTGYTPVK